MAVTSKINYLCNFYSPFTIFFDENKKKGGRKNKSLSWWKTKWDDGNCWRYIEEIKVENAEKIHIFHSCRLIHIRLMIRELATSWIKFWNLMFFLHLKVHFCLRFVDIFNAFARLLHTSLHSICWLGSSIEKMEKNLLLNARKHGTV